MGKNWWAIRVGSLKMELPINDYISVLELAEELARAAAGGGEVGVTRGAWETTAGTRERLTAALADLDAREGPEVAPGCPADAADAAMRRREQDAQDRFVVEMRGKRAALEAALGRLDAGEYGACRVCEEPINARRLAAVPTAQLCVECQAEAEG